MSISFSSYTMLTERKYDQDWYEWCIFSDDTLEKLKNIESVEYTLHPTFPNPTRVNTNREQRFALFSSGWGGFSIPIRVFFKDGRQESQTYFLNLVDDGWPKPQASLASL